LIAVDTSAVIAILLDEPERAHFLDLIVDRQPALMSAVNLQEAGMVMRSRLGQDGLDDLFDLVRTLQIEIVAYDEDQARLALDAFDRFGKGIDPRARLNFGDCAAYALAKTLDVPLLYKGTDFGETDSLPLAPETARLMTLSADPRCP
jgi:ribonuclease VapC